MRSNAVLKRCLIACAALASVAVSVAPAGAADAYKGRLDVRHTDDFTHGASSTRYTLRESRNKRYSIRPAVPPNIPSGSRVYVRGTKRGSVIRGAAVRPQPGVRPATAGVLGEYRTAVILVNFTDDRSQPWTPATVSDRFFGTGSSIDTFFKEQSWNQVDLTGNVYGWYELAQAGAGCDEDAWAAEANAQATAAGVALGNFHSIAYVFPDQADCSWAGLAELPGNQMWLNGDISVRVASHELGHNMGVHHAGSLACNNGGTPAAIGSSCSFSEYGDPFSSMGNSSRRMASWHLQQLGYLAPANVQTVSTGGTYTLRSTLDQTTQPVLLKIPKTPTTSPAEYYYLDLRASGGVFDNFGVADPAIKGVTIRVGNGPSVRNQSKLIDTTPDSYLNSSTDFVDAPLQPGATFSDGTVSITTQSIAGGVATVDVAWSGTPPDTQAPSAPAITEAIHHGSYVDLAWSGSTDNVGVSGYRVKRGSQTLATLGAGARTYRDNVYNTYAYVVEAFDAAGNAKASTVVYPTPYTPPPAPPPPGDDGSPAPPPVVDTVTPPPADVTAPALKLIAPGRNASLRRKATVRASATDAVGVQVLEFWVDNVRLATRRGGDLRLTWNLKRIRPGRHKVMILARDAAGNTAKRTVAVRVRR